MRRGVAYLIVCLLLWLVCQLSQVFLYKLPILFGLAGYVMFGAGWLISRHGVQWDKRGTTRSWLVAVAGLVLMLSGSSIMLGRWLESTRGSFWSWGLAASLGVVIVALLVMGLWIMIFPARHSTAAFWLSAFVVMAVAAFFNAHVVWFLGLVPWAPEGSLLGSFWIYLLAVVVFYVFHRGLASKNSYYYDENFDILRGVSGVSVGRDMVWR